jgi:hypothetical protein
MELALPCGEDGKMHYARVVKRLQDSDGNPIGVADNNPILDTWAYKVEWHDGHREQMFANTIAENLFAQVDDEGNRHVLLQDIIAHCYTDEALSEEDAFVIVADNIRRRKPTTKGWEICMQGKYGSTSWIPLKDAKDSHPVQLAEYAIAHDLQDCPVFAWWVPFVMKKRDRIIENFRRKARYVAGGHMTEPPASITFSLVVSRGSVRIALLIAARNGLDMMTADIQNAYLHALCREKIWTIAGPEFGSNEGSVMIIVRALFG